jgi:hypoxia up-regulated 1
MASRLLKASPLAMLLAIVFFFSTQAAAAQAVLGVDLGTEYIKAALVKPGKPLDIVLTKDSRRKETSAVAFKPAKGGAKEGQFPERLYGADAMALAPRFPGEVFPNLKTLLGLPVDDAVVQEYAARHPALQLQPHESRGTSAFKSNTFTPEEEAWMVEELLAMELQSIQANAEVAAGDGSSVRNIVLTVPTFYTVEEKRAVRAAADLAGLNVLSLISDGLAVGLNYATNRQFPNVDEGAKPEHHLIFDMGAGSTKASVIRFQGRSVKDVGKFNKTIQEVQVIGSGWDRTLGGDALNNLIIDDMVNQFVDSKAGKKVGATVEAVKGHGRAVAKLTKDAERARHVLSANQNTGATFEALYEDADFKYKISRAEFEAMAESHAERVAVAINDALKMSGLDLLDIDSVILHGGASRTPFVQKALEKIFGSEDKIRSNVNSDEAAVFGAAFRAAELSPSFRVKEIRILEGAYYPTGLKRVGSSSENAKNQRLWSPISPAAGPAKELTLTEETDFATTFYQQIGSEVKNVKSFETKNLTATVAALKEKYPSCVESGTVFRLGVKLSTENGEVQVVKAAVECDAEIKEGFVDGVKNLFGFGKKDQKPLGEAPDETETIVDTPDSSEEAESSATTTTTSSDSAATDAINDGEQEGSEEEMKAETKKIELVSIPVDFVLENLGIPQLTKTELSKSKDRLKAFAAADKARIQREEALNQLEAYTYKLRDLLDDETFVGASTETERALLSEKGLAVSEWLYEGGAEAPKEELKAKLKELQDVASPIQKRVREAEKRPEEVAKLKEALEQTEVFFETIRKQITEYEEWHASASAAESSSTNADASAETPAGDSDGVEDDAERTMEDVVKERGPIPPLYTREDMEELESLAKSTQEWLDKTLAKQEALAATDDPVLLVRDINQKREKLEKLGKEFAMKGVKNFNKNTKGKGSKTASAGKSEATIPASDSDKVFSGEDIEELLKNLSEEDWKKLQEESAKMAKEEPAGGHDEL